MRDERRQTNKQTMMIELLSQWKLEAEFRKKCYVWEVFSLIAL